ncbi:pyridoxal phosphate-dependent aminotransferase [Sneathiella sp.]|uniref:pyridoxal phosphate-dependent aminotransferase n=1 Tax=Sneathiella sp. TaxID=1964365 RepID=UPI002616C6AE|nr:aminotransferase class I/II-fold pyridoxal phosphate-dependent enzyme [Sneathiella sp.]MDF2368280.1 aminotransferase class I/II-fold pyridoxal phosphate-dependent enzyme [Sneathiella sp.]
MANNSGREISPFIAMEVLKAANLREQEGREVFHMEVGQPGTSAPSKVLAAAKDALETQQIGYTDALGIAPLREAIARHYKDFYGVDVPKERVVVTTGSSGGFLLTFLSAFKKGEGVLLAEPGYPAYRNILTSLDLVPVGLPCHAETNFQPTPELIDKVSDPIAGLLVASPSNPTGTMIKHDELAALVDYCAGRGLQFISDEIYHGITYDEPATTALELTEEAIVINSFSKYFSMTGWRLGWMIVPERMVSTIEKLAQNLFISPPALSQYAAVKAFECMDEMEDNVRGYARNRDILLTELPKLGLSRLASADGAFYVYADVREFTNDSVAFCKKMLNETGVAATPGLDFDPHRGTGYVRFSFAGSTATIEQAIERLKSWSGIKKGSR